MNDHQTYDQVIQAVQERLPLNKRVRRTLPANGRLRIDRQLPFLCVYRIPSDREDLGTRELVTTEGAYLVASGDETHAEEIGRLLSVLMKAMREYFGEFLILEVWAEQPEEDDGYPSQPRFDIVSEDADQIPTVVSALEEACQGLRINGMRPPIVGVRNQGAVAPPGMRPLLVSCPEEERPCLLLGLAVAPIYRARGGKSVFPLVLQQLRSQATHAIRRAVFAFAGAASGKKSPHFDMYGPSALVRATSLADQALSEIAQSFDFLLQVTPVNDSEAWKQFVKDGHRKAPNFYYRPLPYHPHLLKRKLFEIPIEHLEDATLTHLFWEKQVELDRQLSALRDLETPEFLNCSLQLYGGVEEALLELALQMLSQISPEVSRRDEARESLDAEAISRAAREEIDSYHRLSPGFQASIEVRDDISAGMMVSRDKLLISESTCIAPERLESLLHHEVGTHLLTYFNGRNQPIRQLSTGLAGYESLQEGLAVLAEFLVGGLTAARLRTLAGRVVAVWSVVEGETFVETFERLRDDHRFSARAAYVMTLRAHRGGGLTKDAVYLRGLWEVFDYLRSGHDAEPLYVGKIALKHLPFVRELRRRDVIRPPMVLPRFWNDPDLHDRLEECRNQTLQELLELKP